MAGEGSLEIQGLRAFFAYDLELPLLYEQLLAVMEKISVTRYKATGAKIRRIYFGTLFLQKK